MYQLVVAIESVRHAIALEFDARAVPKLPVVDSLQP
jgi:hypothetical protein